MQANLPIKIQEVFKLPNLGLNPDLFKFGNLTFESEKYICVKDNQVSSNIWLNCMPNIFIVGSCDYRYVQELSSRPQANEGRCYTHAQTEKCHCFESANSR